MGDELDPMGQGVKLISKAVDLDGKKRHTESLIYYQLGIDMLMKALKTIPAGDKRDKVRGKIEGPSMQDRGVHETCGESQRTHRGVEESWKYYREQITIDENSTGFSYKSILERFMDDDVRSVEVEDPYIRSPHQCDNFVRFLELAVQKCPNLKRVKLITGTDGNGATEQAKRLESVRKSLEKIPGRESIHLQIEYLDTLHDREIRFDNGWVVKIGRGLDYFKQMDRFTVGFSDFDLRLCRATVVDIFHKKEIRRVR